MTAENGKQVACNRDAIQRLKEFFEMFGPVCIRRTSSRHLFGARALASTAGLLNMAACATSNNESTPDSDTSRYVVTYRSDWSKGIDASIKLQVARIDAITATAMTEFRGTALKATMRRSDAFQGIANGTPRAELAFSPLTQFSVGGEYEIHWSTMIPRAYVLDQKQPEIITQIHQSSSRGSPPFALMLAGRHYQVDIRGLNAAKTVIFGNPQVDEGRVIHWLLRYKPDDTGVSSVTDLYMDGTLVARGGAIQNAYPGERNGYLKIGIYKWNWDARQSDVEERTMYYGNIEVLKRVEPR